MNCKKWVGLGIKLGINIIGQPKLSKHEKAIKACRNKNSENQLKQKTSDWDLKTFEKLKVNVKNLTQCGTKTSYLPQLVIHWLEVLHEQKIKTFTTV